MLLAVTMVMVAGIAVGAVYVGQTPDAPLHLRATPTYFWEFTYRYPEPGNPPYDQGYVGHVALSSQRFSYLSAPALLLHIQDVVPPLPASPPEPITAVQISSTGLIRAWSAPDHGRFFGTDQVWFEGHGAGPQEVEITGEPGAGVELVLNYGLGMEPSRHSALFAPLTPHGIRIDLWRPDAGTAQPESDAAWPASGSALTWDADAPATIEFVGPTDVTAISGFTGTYQLGNSSHTLLPTDQLEFVRAPGETLFLFYQGDLLSITGTVAQASNFGDSILAARWSGRPPWLDELLLGLGTTAFGVLLGLVVARRRPRSS
jgi:hypothetical protein